MKTALSRVALICFFSGLGCLHTASLLAENGTQLGLDGKSGQDSYLALKAVLGKDWTSLTFASRYECSCTGVSYLGFRIRRSDSEFELEPWGQSGQGHLAVEKWGAKQPISARLMEKLISEGELYFWQAKQSKHPLEKVGDAPKHLTIGDEEMKRWWAAYLAAGGAATMDLSWIEVRLTTGGVTETYTDLYAEPDGKAFLKWVGQFGDVRFSQSSTR